MKHAVKDDSGNLHVLNVIKAIPPLPENWEYIGEIPEALQETKHLKFDVDGTTVIEDTDAADTATLREAALAKAEKGRKYKDLASLVLHIIGGHNVDNGLDATQIASIKTSHPEAFAALSDGQPFTAKPFIDAITPDGTIITQEELDHVAEAYAMFAETDPDLVPA